MHAHADLLHQPGRKGIERITTTRIGKSQETAVPASSPRQSYEQQFVERFATEHLPRQLLKLCQRQNCGKLILLA